MAASRDPNSSCNSDEVVVNHWDWQVEPDFSTQKLCCSITLHVTALEDGVASLVREVLLYARNCQSQGVWKYLTFVKTGDILQGTDTCTHMLPPSCILMCAYGSATFIRPLHMTCHGGVCDQTSDVCVTAN